MPAEWHITRQGKQYGPFTEERLRELAFAKKLSPNDLIWSSGMAQWVAAGTLQSLFPSRPAVPVGIAIAAQQSCETEMPTTMGMPVIDSRATPRKKYRPRKSKTNRKLHLAVVAVAVSLALFAAVRLATSPLVSPDGVLGSVQANRLLSLDRNYVLVPPCRGITEEAAEILLESETLNLSRIARMSDGVAQVLANHRGKLHLGLSSLTPEFAAIFAGSPAKAIWFPNVRDLTEESVKALFRKEVACEFWFPELDRLHVEAKTLDGSSDRLHCLGRDNRDPVVYGKRTEVAEKEPDSGIDYNKLDANLKRYDQKLRQLIRETDEEIRIIGGRR